MFKAFSSFNPQCTPRACNNEVQIKEKNKQNQKKPALRINYSSQNFGLFFNLMLKKQQFTDKCKKTEFCCQTFSRLGSNQQLGLGCQIGKRCSTEGKGTLCPTLCIKLQPRNGSASAGSGCLLQIQSLYKLGACCDTILENGVMPILQKRIEVLKSLQSLPILKADL